VDIGFSSLVIVAGGLLCCGVGIAAVGAVIYAVLAERKKA